MVRWVSMRYFRGTNGRNEANSNWDENNDCKTSVMTTVGIRNDVLLMRKSEV